VVGRAAPLRTLEEALSMADGGRPSVTLLSGEAGVGKTRLAAAAEARARALGFLVLHGESVEFGGEELAYAPFAAALRAFPEWLDERPLHERLLGRLGELAREPVLLVLEDIHWADRSTGELLAFLARNLREERLAILATYRTDDELPPHLRRLAAELARRPAVTRLALGPLGPDEVAEQLEAIAGAPVPAALAADLHARAGGNPFFVEELFAAPDAGTLADAVLLRVERLGPAAGRALAVLAAAGGRLEDDVLERLAPDADGLRAALDAGDLVRGEGGVAFRHGLIGEVVYGRLLPAERRELHRAIAAALPAEPIGRRAHQFHRAGLRAEALVASVEAGLEAARLHAFSEAWMHLERALELWDPAVPLPVDRVELLTQAGQAARFAGDPDRAVALCREALAGFDHAADPARAALLFERLGEFQFWDDEAALECCRRALALAPGEPRLLAAEGHALMGLRRWQEARERCEAALEAGARPRITLGVVLAFLGEPDAGEAHLQRGLELSESAEDTARAYVHLGEVRRVRGDHAGAIAAWQAGEAVAERFGLSSHAAFFVVNAADDLLRLGRWDEAARRLAEAARMELGRTAAPLRRAAAGELHALRGDFDAARRELDAPAGDALPSEIVAPLAGARATLALAEGDPAAAQVHVDGALAMRQDPFYTPPLYALGLRAEAELAERARAGRRPIDARRAAGLMERLDALLAGVSAPDGLAHRALAHAEHARVTGDGAPERWRAAAAAWDALAAPYPAAYARLHAAEATVRAGDRHGAATLLAEAHATAAGLGARPLQDAIEALARRARLDVAAAPEPPVGEEGPAGLTAREAEVLRLLAEGLTNREIAGRLFISRKTVSAHLAHIFAKLDVHTRTEAAGRARALGVV